MRVPLPLFQKLLILAIVPIMVSIGIVSKLMNLLQQADQAAIQESHSKEVWAKSASLLGKFSDVRADFDLYMFTHDKFYNGCLANDINEVPLLVSDLRKLAKGHVQEEVASEKIYSLASDAVELLTEGRRSVNYDGRSLAFTGLMNFQTRVKDLIRDLKQETKQLAATAEGENKQNAELQRQSRKSLSDLLLVVAALVIVLSISLATWFYKGIINPLRILMENAHRLAEQKSLHPMSCGSDEFSQVDRTFHHMAARLSEHALKERALIDNAVDVICSLDEQMSFTNINQASTSKWGYSREEIVGQPLKQFIHCDDRPNMAAMLEQIKLGKSNTATIETRLITRHGKVLDILWSPYWSDKEHSFFCVAHDISERKELERMKQEFIAMVSHDLRTPLCAIRGILTMFEVGMFGQLSPDGLKYVRIADRDSQRLLKLVTDLLDAERLQFGALTLSVEKMSAKSIFGAARDSVLTVAEQQDITVEILDTPLSVEGDKERLVQLLVNLLANAIKFSNAGGTVTMSATPIESGTELQVIDHGRGVPDDKKSLIFERFKQVEKTDATVKKGTGLGLAICKQIAEAHGGAIFVTDTVGGGSTFCVRLPDRAGEREELAQTEQNEGQLQPG